MFLSLSVQYGATLRPESIQQGCADPAGVTGLPGNSSNQSPMQDVGRRGQQGHCWEKKAKKEEENGLGICSGHCYPTQQKQVL